MIKLIEKAISSFLFRVVGQKRLESAILLISRLGYIDLLTLAYKNMGILKYENSLISGEHFVITNVLKKYIKTEKPIFFDVGANIGDYAKELREEFPNATIYVFEPNANTFEKTQNNLANLDIYCFNFGMGNQAEKKKIYSYARDKSSQHASIYKEVLCDLHKAQSVVEIEIEITTIDKFCGDKDIKYIDFLKIDTEGNELEVIQGATQMILENRLGIIQFEFNEMNIISRVFLRDFYKILAGYNIYRLDSNKLIHLFEYNSTNEIFKFQNFLAINKEWGND
ncbi:MAG: FkbM family methyltransferase [Phormidium sp.]